MKTKDSLDEISHGPLKGLTRNVLILGWVSFLGDIASEMLYPIMPLFIQGFLGVPVLGLGIIEGFAEAVASILKVVSGRLTDHSLKRKPWIFTGYLLSGVARPIIGAASGWGLVVTGRMLDRTGKGLRTSPRDALLGDSIAPKYRGKAFGWHRGMDTLGAALGPLVALLFLRYFSNNLRWLFYISFVPGLLAAATVLWIREVPHGNQPSTHWQLRALPWPFWKFIIACTVFNLTNSSDIFILLKYHQLNISNTTMILSYCSFNLVYALSSPWLGELSDRMGKARIFSGGLLCFALVYFTFGLSDTWIGMLIGYLLYGIYMAATEGVSKALALDLAPSDLKGTAIGVLGLAIGFSTLISSSIAGFLWDYLNPQAPFWMATGGALFSFVLFQILVKNGDHGKD